LISVKVYRAKSKLLESNKPLTADNIKDVLTGNNEKKYFIVEAFFHHNKQTKALVGREIAPATLTRYRTACDFNLTHFILLNQINNLFLQTIIYSALFN
jgi:hypothetical protein